MIDYETLSYWIGSQFGNIKDAFYENPSDYLYGALKAYESINSQIELVRGSQLEPRKPDTKDNQVQADCKHVSKFNVMNERGNIYVTCYDCHKVLSEECKHESDGNHGLLTDPFQYQFQYLCIKCGEFYR